MLKQIRKTALIAGMVCTFCFPSCTKTGAKCPMPQSETTQITAEKPLKLSLSTAIFEAASETASEQLSISKQIEAIITPSTAKNAEVDWSVEWGNNQSGEVTEYITVTPETDGALRATVTCKQPFEGEIVVVCITRQGGYVATCTVTYAGQPTDMSLSGNIQETDGAYRFGVGNTYEYAVTLTNPFGKVGEKFNDIAVSVTGVGQVQLGYMEHFKSTEKDVWYDASNETAEYDSLKDTLISASYESGVLKIKTLSAVEDFYRGTGRMDGGRTIFYEGKFRQYLSDCYFNITLTERNSGCKKTIKVIYDPGAVTGVNMSVSEMEF